LPAARSRRTAFAAVAFALFLALGFYVSAYPEPQLFVAFEKATVGRGVPFAWWVTHLCYPTVLGPICIALLFVEWRFPQWRAPVFCSFASVLVCWLATSQFQHAFHRPRRLDWLVKRETAFSFPSSHGAVATGFYVLWATFVWQSGLRKGVRVALATLLVAIALAVYWSRLALGAHYLTDLLGSIFLGAAIAAVAGAWAVRR
jgi:undecaprenyl-diphosphatase